MTASVSLPTPVFQAPRTEWNGKPSRSRTVSFPLEGTEVVTDKGVSHKEVQVSFFHHGDRKMFTASANQVTVTKEDTFTSTAFWVFGGVALARTPVARYSEKALDAFVADIMATFPTQVLRSEALQRMFTVLEDDPR